MRTKKPSLNWTKRELEEWLKKEKITFPVSLSEEWAGLPGCCAFAVVYELKARLMHDIPEHARSAVYALKLKWLFGVPRTKVLATTNDVEQVEEAKLLRETGFKKLTTVTNPIHGTRVTLWLANTGR